jgi:hypothetical protein
MGRRKQSTDDLDFVCFVFFFLLPVYWISQFGCAEQRSTVRVYRVDKGGCGRVDIEHFNKKVWPLPRLMDAIKTKIPPGIDEK